MIKNVNVDEKLLNANIKMSGFLATRLGDIAKKVINGPVIIEHCLIIISGTSL